MHTTQGQFVNFNHNGDYDGDVIITPRDDYLLVDEQGRVRVPFSDLKELVADYVRSERISRLELACSDEILDILPE